MTTGSRDGSSLPDACTFACSSWNSPRSSQNLVFFFSLGQRAGAARLFCPDGARGTGSRCTESGGHRRLGPWSAQLYVNYMLGSCLSITMCGLRGVLLVNLQMLLFVVVCEDVDLHTAPEFGHATPRVIYPFQDGAVGMQ